MELDISVVGAEPIKLRLSRIAEKASDLSGAFELLYQSFCKIEEEQFEGEGTFSGGWAALSETYKQWKQAHCERDKILQCSADLYRAMTGQSGDKIKRISPQEAVFGGKVTSKRGVDYGLALHGKDGKGFTAGGWAKGKKVPARPVIALAKEHIAQWTRIIQAHVMGGDIGGSFPGLFTRPLF